MTKLTATQVRALKDLVTLSGSGFKSTLARCRRATISALLRAGYVEPIDAGAYICETANGPRYPQYKATEEGLRLVLQIRKAEQDSMARLHPHGVDLGHVHSRECYDDPGPGHGSPQLICNHGSGRFPTTG